MDIQQIFIIAIAIVTVATTAETTTAIQYAEAVDRSGSQCNPGSDSGSIDLCVLSESGSLIAPRACGGQTGSDGSFASQCGSTANNQYQGSRQSEYDDSRQSEYDDSRQSEYDDSRQSNEGSQAYQQCIEAAADVGDKLSDYEVRNCEEDPSYRH
jgi:hypothetical protein